MKAKKAKATKNKLQKKSIPFRRNHPFVVPIVTLFVLFISSIFAFLFLGGETIGATDSKVIQLYIDGRTRSIPTRATTVREVLNRSQIQLVKEDVVEPSLDTPITSTKFSVNVYRAKPVTIIDEKGKKVITKTAETEPSAMARKAGYKLYPEDNVEVATPDVSMKNGVIGTQVVIDRATPVKMNLFGTTYDVRTHAKTVADLAKERNINYTNASILPNPETPLRADQVIFITEPGKQIVSSEEVIPNDEEIITDQGLKVGTVEVREPGSPGRKAVVYEVAANGTKKALQEVIIANPVKKVTVKGAKSANPNISVAADKAALMAAAGISPSDYGAVDYIISRESGWKPGSLNASGCAGLGQACPGSKLINACPNWSQDAVCQLRYFSNYAERRGGWQKMYAAWQANGWW